jgi:hypothetical protein
MAGLEERQRMREFPCRKIPPSSSVLMHPLPCGAMKDQADINNMKILFPGITDEEAEEASERFRRFAAILLRIEESLESDPEAQEKFRRLTEGSLKGNLTSERSSITNPSVI